MLWNLIHSWHWMLMITEAGCDLNLYVSHVYWYRYFFTVVSLRFGITNLKPAGISLTAASGAGEEMGWVGSTNGTVTSSFQQKMEQHVCVCIYSRCFTHMERMEIKCQENTGAWTLTQILCAHVPVIFQVKKKSCAVMRIQHRSWSVWTHQQRVGCGAAFTYS